MKLNTHVAARWRQELEAWFRQPAGPFLRLRCPSCCTRLHIDGWKKLSAPFVERESMVCKACGHETILKDDWVQ